jgi:uncharacterized hydrophobic protein (TIGR00271 family)
MFKIRPADAARQDAMLKSLTPDSVLSLNFAVLLLASCTIATFGLLINNSAVIIGAMIVAPLISPIQAFAYGALEARLSLLRASALTLLAGSFAAVSLAAILSRIVALPNLSAEILARSRPTLLDLGIALAAGVVCGFARVRPAVSASLAGTAIAVALMPPLCVIGIELAHGRAGLALGATLLYVTNLLGITVACMVVYGIAGFRLNRHAGRTYAVAIALIAVLAIPLALSFVSLLRQSRLEYALRHELLTNTQTFHRVRLVDTQFNWLATPPLVTLTVRSSDPVTSSQVDALENFARAKTGQQFDLIFEVAPMVEVSGTGVDTKGIDDPDSLR